MIELLRTDVDKLNAPVDWSTDVLQEISIKTPDDFLKIKETLTRIGITVKGEKTLNQSCHILHKRGKYYIVSFLEVFALDGKPVSMKISDIARRNTIAGLLQLWGLCELKPNEKNIGYKLPTSSLKVVPYKEKKDWQLISRCSIGNK